MKKQDVVDVLIDGLIANTHGKAFGWKGQQVVGNMDGLKDATLEDQVGFLQEMLNRGVDRVIAERISNASVKTLEQAAERASYADLQNYERGTRVGGTRINTVDDAAKSLWFANFKTLLADKKEGAVKLAATFGITLEEVISEGGRKLKKLVGIDNPEFVAYLAERIAKPDYQEKGAKELARVQAERAAKGAKGDAAL